MVNDPSGHLSQILHEFRRRKREKSVENETSAKLARFKDCENNLQRVKNGGAALRGTNMPPAYRSDFTNVRNMYKIYTIYRYTISGQNLLVYMRSCSFEGH